MSKGKILFQLTGSIACYKACQVISRLAQSGHEVEVVASKAALEFVGEATLEALAGRRVHTDTFEPGGYLQHIHLMRWADLAILAPATANSLNKLANGIGDDLISTLFLAHDFKKPYLVAPAMNSMMYRHPATQSSLARLREWGIEVLETPSGTLACGEIGEGRLLEPELIIAQIEARLGQLASKPAVAEAKQILVTSGGTREPIDGVRAITNFSSGRTGARVTEELLARGHRLTFLHAEGSARPDVPASAPLSLRAFSTFDSLAQALHDELSSTRYDAVIHLAAVGDYSIANLEAAGASLAPGSTGKIESGEDLVIHLKRNPKLVTGLRAMSLNDEIRVIAFKLTNTPDLVDRLAAVEKLAVSSRPDFIVHNDLSEIAARGEGHLSTIYACGGAASGAHPIARTSTKKELAGVLESLISSGGKAK